MTNEHFGQSEFYPDDVEQPQVDDGAVDAKRSDDRARHESAPTVDVPLEPWVIALAQQVTDVAPTAIPRDMMWARIRQHRMRGTDIARTGAPAAGVPAVTHIAPLFAQQLPATSLPTRSSQWMLRVAGIAALLVGGIGIGRFLLPASGPSKYQLASAASISRADSIASLGLGPDALAAMPPSSEPARVAMDEHLARTVALLVAVRNDDAAARPSADIGGWARDLLGTTRLLLDEPQLADMRTRRLLQDLELVLAQIIQVRQSAPETARAPGETMRETNLLPRMRAAVRASRPGDDMTLGGGL